MTLRPKLSAKELSIPEMKVNDSNMIIRYQNPTFEILPKTIQKAASRHGIVESYLCEQDSLQESCLKDSDNCV